MRIAVSVTAVLVLLLLACTSAPTLTSPRAADPTGPGPKLGEVEPGTEAPGSRLPRLEGPTVVVVGTVQDGGLPHTACSGERCEAARRDPAHRRYVASLALVLPETEEVYLFDATPDITAQLALLRPYRPARDPAAAGTVDRDPLAGIFLTHAHIGHYLGLAQLGFEVVHSRGTPVYATPRMAGFLRDNGPWSQLVRLGNIVLHDTPPGEPVRLGQGSEPELGSGDSGSGVTVTSLLVPHRDEYADTVAYRIEGPRRTLLYLPDTEPWERWPRPFENALEGVDIALLDATFYSLDELPGRRVEEIGHPLVTSTLDLLEERVRRGTLRVIFTHLNHSNPALEEGSAARREIEARGFSVLREGDELPL